MNKLKLFLQQAVEEPKIFSPILTGLLMNALTWFLIVWRLPVSAAWIPLHYNSYFGIDWIGPWWNIIYYPVAGLLTIIFNLVLMAWLPGLDRRFALLLNWVSALVNFIVLVALILLIVNYFG